jgi:hypothetical protein
MQHRREPCPHCDEDWDFSRQLGLRTGTIRIAGAQASELFAGLPLMLARRNVNWRRGAA